MRIEVYTDTEGSTILPDEPCVISMGHSMDAMTSASIDFPAGECKVPFDE